MLCQIYILNIKLKTNIYYKFIFIVLLKLIFKITSNNILNQFKTILNNVLNQFKAILKNVLNQFKAILKNVLNQLKNTLSLFKIFESI